MPMYQDVVAANQAVWAWALVELSGLDFAPYIGTQHATGHGAFLYQQSGPFPNSVALSGDSSGYLTVPFPAGVAAPWWVEAWFKLGSYPPAANVFYSFGGNGLLNGTGYYVATNGHIHHYEPPTFDIDTGVIVGDAGWHLIQYGHTDNSGTSLEMAFDGVIRFSHSISGLVNPSPATWGFMSDSSGNSVMPNGSVSYPAIYPGIMQPQNLLATFTAASDPAAALALVRASTAPVTSAILQQILNSVRKTY